MQELAIAPVIWDLTDKSFIVSNFAIKPVIFFEPQLSIALYSAILYLILTQVGIYW
jgi:hypothetical protein